MTTASKHISAEIQADVQKLKWLGWLVLGAVVLAWWLSLNSISNSRAVAVIEDRQVTQYARLREDIAELKSLFREFLKSQPEH